MSSSHPPALLRRLAMRVLFGCVPGLTVAAEADRKPPGVALVQEANGFTLSNQRVTARIDKVSGNLIALKVHDMELLRGGRGYWSFAGGGNQFSGPGVGEVRQDPAANGGSRAEVACNFTYKGLRGTLPCDVSLRYVLGPDDHGIYAYAVWMHRAGMPGFGLGEARYALKLDPRIFDYMTIDDRRRRVMPTGEDWDQGRTLNLKEVRRMTTGRYAGQAEHKYSYSAMLSEVPAYGWSSTAKRVGLWLVNPSMEYIGGGPTKVELTGHLDVNPGGAPTLLNMWQGSHYGGTSLSIARDEEWNKVIGPFLIYVNQGGDHEELWRDALAAAKQQGKAWPYRWITEPLYQASERTEVTGTITTSDPAAAEIGKLRVGLTPPEYDAPGRRETRIGWQRDSKNYQYWVQADSQGRFRIPHVRPGRYVLRAFADGVLGEFAQSPIEVAKGTALDLGAREWKPERLGRQVWEIGIANRSAEEFRHGDDYWHWGTYLQYAKDFPQEVNFIVGKSDWRRDWNFVQPPRLGPEGQRIGDSTWRIQFDLAEAPKGTMILRIAFCGARAGCRVFVSANDQSIGDTGLLPENGVMHRDGIRGAWFERKFSFPAARLHQGTNVIALRSESSSWHQGVNYDYLRLEMDESSPIRSALYDSKN